MKTKRLIATLFLAVVTFGISLDTHAQQDPQYSMYMFNPLVTNPAYAGSRDALSATILGRKQWVSIPGAPLTGTISIHSPLKNEAIALGLSVIHDEIGATQNTGVFADAAYRLNLNAKGTKLSFGLKGGFDIFSGDFRGLISNDQGDIVQNTPISGKLLPNVGAGIYLYDENFYVGLTAPKFLQNDLSDIAGSSAKQNSHYFLMAGYSFKVNSVVDIVPSVTLKAVSDAPVSIDGNLNFLFYDKLWIGAGYRFGDALVADIMYHFSNKIRAGYAYDYTLSDLGAYTSGSHEIMINYDLDFLGKGFKTPRKF